MAWYKRNESDFLGEIFFTFKVSEFLFVLFNVIVQHFPVIFWAAFHFISENNGDKIFTQKVTFVTLAPNHSIV